mgnify:CR=1 FL=1
MRKEPGINIYVVAENLIQAFPAEGSPGIEDPELKCYDTAVTSCKTAVKLYFAFISTARRMACQI